MEKKFYYVLVAVLLLSAAAFLYGCGSNATGGGGGGGGGGSSGVVTNYTISGNIPQLKTISSSYTPPGRTVVAIGTNGEMYHATVSSDGSFSLGIVSGYPYVVGFYDGLTLEGYVCVPSVGWDSLPIIDPSSTSISLGTLTLESGSLTVTCEKPVDSLMDSLMSMAPGTAAAFYGSIDDMMKNLLNIDVNGNNIPDYLEDTGTYLTIDEWGGPDKNMNTGEVQAMLTGYNTYVPCPVCYMYWVTSRCSMKKGTVASLTLPTPLAGWNGGSSFTTITAEVKSSPNDYDRYAHFGDTYDKLLDFPTTPPSGTYTAEVEGVNGTGTYTFVNCDFSGAFPVGTTEGVIYPVFHLNTYEDGGVTYISSVEYMWRKTNGSGSYIAADPGEVKAMVGNYSMGTAIAGVSPNIQFCAFPGSSESETSCPSSYIGFDRDGDGDGTGTLDLRGNNVLNGGPLPRQIRLVDVCWIQSQYMTSTNIQIDFRFCWDTAPF